MIFSKKRGRKKFTFFSFYFFQTCNFHNDPHIYCSIGIQFLLFCKNCNTLVQICNNKNFMPRSWRRGISVCTLGHNAKFTMLILWVYEILGCFLATCMFSLSLDKTFENMWNPSYSWKLWFLSMGLSNLDDNGNKHWASDTQKWSSVPKQHGMDCVVIVCTHTVLELLETLVCQVNQHFPST